MATRFCLEEAPPAEAEDYKGLRIYRFERNGRPCVKTWRPKSRKPFNHYQFRSAEQRERWIEQTKAARDTEIDYKLQRKAEADQSLAKMLDEIKPGTLLCNSWGWEQTNVDFYQVIERHGRRVILREIAGRDVGTSSGMSSMSTYMQPVPDSFTGEPFAKQIGPYGISFKHGGCSITSADSKHYCSWYA